MASAMNMNNDDDNFIQFDLDSSRVQVWWDTIQTRNRYFFELIEMKLYFIEMADLYLLLLEMDDCLDDLETIECPASALHIRSGLERAVQDMTRGLIELGGENDPKAQMYFNTSKSEYKQTLTNYFDLIPY